MNCQSFYLTLLSNSSFEYYPENTTSSFTVHLNKEITLDGGVAGWKLALVDIMFPNTFLNVVKGSNTITVTQFINAGRPSTFLFKRISFHIPVSTYGCVEDVVAEINRMFAEIFDCQLFKENLSVDNRVETCFDAEKVYDVMAKAPPVTSDMEIINVEFVDAKPDFKIHLEGRLSLQLGFTPDENISGLKKSNFPVNIDAGIPSETLIYVDLIQPQIISDTCTQLLKMVKTIDKNTSFGETITREVFNRCYLSVNKRVFQDISVELLDSSGKLLPFNFGTAILTLHFQNDNAPNR